MTPDPSTLSVAEMFAEVRSHVEALRDDLAARDAAIVRLAAELERERLRLAACGVAALGNTPQAVAARVPPGHEAWSASYADVCGAVDRELRLRAEIAAVVAAYDAYKAPALRGKTAEAGRHWNEFLRRLAALAGRESSGWPA